MIKKFLSVITAFVFLLPADVFAMNLLPSDTGISDAFSVNSGEVTLIVEVEGDPVLSAPRAQTDGAFLYGSSFEANTRRQQLLKIQSEVEQDIAEAVPAAEKGFVYTNVFNGFSIEADISDIDTISALPNVKNVYIAPEIPIPEPQLTTSLDNIHTSYSYDNLNYRGEGQAICIIDSEFRTDHEFFAAELESPKYSKTDVEDLLKKMTNIKLDADHVYKNKKIPIAYDYTDNDSDTSVSNSKMFHGTHVAGIAAGKNGTAPDDTSFSGVAPEAQLILLKVGTDSGLKYDAIIAALDDAVLLDISAINMSLGAAYVYSDSLYAKSISVAESCGIQVCVSAGNESSGYDSKAPLTTNIDYSSGGCPASEQNAFTVASAQNTGGWFKLGSLETNGETIPFMNASGSSTVFSSAFSDKNINTVYCGSGLASDFQDIDLTDKIAVVMQGDESFSVRMERARAAGAKGILYILNGDVYLNVTLSNISGTTGAVLPGAIIKNTYKDTIINMQSAAVKPVAAINDLTASDGEISSFSSFCTNESLELKPDITAPGGNIYSSYPTGSSNYASMSGTSMSAPHMSGVAALMNQFLNDTASLGKSETALRSENLLMSTAKIIMQKNGVPFSPRVQGSGLVQVEEAMKTPVILQGDDNRTKISLYDNIGDTFELSFKAVNLTDNDVTYDSVKLYTMTDGFSTDSGTGKNYVSGTVALESTADLPSSVTVPANGTADITFTVQLDSEQTAENLKIFTNGFYIDGFSVLSQTDGANPELSIPFTGFYGDWLKAPFFDEPITSSDAVSGNFGLAGKLGSSGYKYLGVNLYSSASNAIKNEKYAAVSPNGDGLFDTMYIVPAPLRGMSKITLKIIDEKKQNKQTYIMDGNVSKFLDIIYTLPNCVDNLSDGQYTVEITGYHIYDTELKNPQTTSIPFVVDTQAPRIISASAVNDQGRTFLDIKAEDNHYLSAVLVSGIVDGTEKTIITAIDPEKIAQTDDTVRIEITGMDYESVVFAVKDFAQNSVSSTLSAYENGVGLLLSEKNITYDSTCTIVNAAAVNPSEDTISCDIMLGFYDESGRLSGVMMSKNTAVSPGNSNISFTSSEDLSGSSELRVFFWESEEEKNMCPVRKIQKFCLTGE